MMMLVDCSGCRTPLELPPGATSIRCALCQAVTHIADPRQIPPPPPSSSGHGGGYGPPAPAPVPTPSPHGAPWGPPPSPHGRKKAVIVGISYRYSRHELKGCINDAKCMRYLLLDRFQFPESSIIMLTEDAVSLTTDALADSVATTGPSPFTSPPSARSSVVPFRPSIAVIVGVLTTIFSLTFLLLLLYAKHCKRTSAGYGGGGASGFSASAKRRNSGVDRAVVELLPVFRFRSLRGHKEGLACAVCLNRFEPAEALRLLPKCRHAFHVECIDTWSLVCRDVSSRGRREPTGDVRKIRTMRTLWPYF